ncbi:MAG: DNA topoisomerase VI subunit B [Phycisphaerae bacterium]
MAPLHPNALANQPPRQLDLAFDRPEADAPIMDITTRARQPRTTPQSTPPARSTRQRRPPAAKDTPLPAPPTSTRGSKSPAPTKPRGLSADTLAKQQREISVSEFFAKNRHLLGFDNKRKALLTTVKEAVDNSLDACEDGGILPDIDIRIEQTDQDRYRVTVRDNGPGIVKAQIPNVFGKLLYGSKFHRLKMSRGQQGIGISAAGMYGLITTGKPVRIISRTGTRAQAHLYQLAIDTKKNRPDIIKDDTVDVDWPHGTEVRIDLVAAYNKGRQSVDEYVELTAIANPHARILYHPPAGGPVDFPRGTDALPEETKEIKPHPYGIELGTFLKMLKETQSKQLGAFLTNEFSRVSAATAKQVCATAAATTATWVRTVTPQQAERLYQAIQSVRLRAPSTNCLAPIGAEAILTGLLKGIKAEFYTAATRPPTVYRGNPFQIEVGMAYGGALGTDRHDVDNDDDDDNGHVGNKKATEPVQARVIRFANRVPLLYQQSSCCTFKAVLDTKWGNYGVSQANGALPRAPLVILIHMASVWVPFISEGKEAVADYDEIRKEVKLALGECGRRLGTLLRRKRKRADYTRRRDVFTRYIDEVVDAARAMAVFNKDEFRRALIDLSRHHTAQADMVLDDHGKVVKKQLPGNDLGLQDTIVLEQDGPAPDPTTLFDVEGGPKPGAPTRRRSAQAQRAGRTKRKRKH